MKELTPYSILCSAEPIVCYAHYSAYALSNPSTTLVLSSIHDHPLRLTNALAHDTIVASYPFVSPLTESYYKIYSLAFPDEGHHFLAGSDSIIGLFDLSRTGEGPVRSIHTVPSKRRKAVGGGVGMKGIIASMDTSTDGIVAAGTFTRNIGLYDHQGADSCVAVFSLAGESGGAFDRSGGGVTQVLWSPCGRYLYVAERQSSCVLAYDIRVTGKLLVKLEGRNANTSQRLGIDTVHTAVGHEVWAGCLDGSVKVWSNAYESEESKPPDAEWMAHEGQDLCLNALGE